MEQEQGQLRPELTAGVAAARQPHLALLHACMLLSGFGTVFLGPALPTLAAAAHVTDRGSGLFFFAQFIGAFLGGITTSRRLWISLLRGAGTAAIGFLLLGFCTAVHASLPWDAAVLLPLGFGVGQMLTSVNLLASQRFSAHRGAALSLVNFSWSLGAVLAPFTLGSLLPGVALRTVLLFAGALFGIAFLAAAWNARTGRFNPGVPIHEHASAAKLNGWAFLYFALLLFLYGGVETSLSGWITTFGLRFGSSALRSSALGTTALWIGITSGRALTPLLLRKLRERSLLIGCLITSALLTTALSQSHGGTPVVLLCALLGISLAPWFPLVLSAMLGEGAHAQQVGTIIAVSGIGAATLPLLVGELSRGSGSLRTALLVPVLGLLLLLAMSFRRPQPSTGSSTEPITESV